MDPPPCIMMLQDINDGCIETMIHQIDDDHESSIFGQI